MTERVARSADRGPAAAGVLAVVVGVGHLFFPGLGLPTFAARLFVDPALLLADPRPALFVLSGAALVVGAALGRGAPNRRPYYLGGVVLSLGYVAGYLGWHLSGHGGFLPGREPLYHGLSPVENVLSHLTAEPLAAALLVLELALAALLARLLR
jgi:hypothetical protein